MIFMLRPKLMLLGNVGVYPIKAFVVWMWGYNCLLNVLELKFLCYTTVFFFVPLKLCLVLWNWKSFY